MSNIVGTDLPCTQGFDWAEMGLPAPDLSELDVPFTLEELKTAVFDTPSDKAPGPDGFSAGFFKTSWGVVKDDLLRALNKFYDLNDPSFNSLNTAFYVLLPKNETPSTMSHYRPISLIHAFAKLISKVLSARLKPYMDELVSPCQSAFISGRSIQDNFLYVQNIAKHYHQTKTPSLLLKLDIAKAFDTVSWTYILDMLQARGFPVRWRNWIALLLRTASSKVLINGAPGRSIEHRRGLRQGDSLSPFLFDLAMEPLHRLLDLASGAGILSKLRGSKCTFRASLYADDVALFINPTLQDIQGLQDILTGFGRATGLQTNLAKSSITPISCDGIDTVGLAQNIGIPVISFPCVYLGMPLSIKKLTKADWQALLDKVDKYLATWKAKMMSKSGRLEMLNSVLSSLPVYLMTINDMPAWVHRPCAQVPPSRRRKQQPAVDLAVVPLIDAVELHQLGAMSEDSCNSLIEQIRSLKIEPSSNSSFENNKEQHGTQEDAPSNGENTPREKKKKTEQREKKKAAQKEKNEAEKKEYFDLGTSSGSINPTITTPLPYGTSEGSVNLDISRFDMNATMPAAVPYGAVQESFENGISNINPTMMAALLPGGSAAVVMPPILGKYTSMLFQVQQNSTALSSSPQLHFTGIREPNDAMDQS
ncbi:hypothetical protein QYE76_026064 [Lolium multiflorum]|uniref:Reverse transcriptase domain-containing protein n=1 Tax=Lolium multiflorum TaxID=4521 RepID=A0AAD8RHY4_LOLMU|nr:hypothetical protein QYE76_026064 [Lolium multiflorum]